MYNSLLRSWTAPSPGLGIRPLSRRLILALICVEDYTVSETLPQPCVGHRPRPLGVRLDDLHGGSFRWAVSTLKRMDMVKTLAYTNSEA